VLPCAENNQRDTIAASMIAVLKEICAELRFAALIVR
jgi:hypothetical protein